LRSFALILLLTLWLAPYPVKAEKSEPLIFERNQTFKETKYVTSPYYSDFQKPSKQTKPAPQIKVRNTQTIKPQTNSGRNSSKTKFASGYCTDYVAQRVKVTWRGNANQWLNNARKQGYQVDRQPTAGSILVTNESRIGHVAYIESVEGSTVTISEWNYKGRFKKSIRTLNINDSRIKGIIHVN